MLKKAVLAAAAFLALTGASQAGVDDYKKGIQEGIKIGIQFEKDRLRQQLESVKETALEALNYKYYFLKGEVPPPLMVTKLEEKKSPSGYSILSVKTEVLPPAYFPVSLFQDLRKEYFDSDVLVIPAGSVVYLDTKNLSTDQIAYYKWLAKTAGYSPVYDLSRDKLFFSVRSREADAEADRKFLLSIGIPGVETGRLKKAITIKAPKIRDNLAEEIRKTAEEVLKKEQKLAGLKVDAKGGLNEVVVNLQKALAAVQALDPERYDRLNLYRLEKDIESILSNLGEAIALQEKYDAVVVTTASDRPSAAVEEKPKVERRVFKKNVLSAPPIERLKAVEKMLGE